MGSIYRGPGIRTDLPTTQQTLSTRATSTAESTTSTEVSIWSTSIPSIKSVTIGLLLRPMFSVYTYNNYLNEIEPTSDPPSSSLSSPSFLLRAGSDQQRASCVTKQGIRESVHETFFPQSNLSAYISRFTEVDRLARILERHGQVAEETKYAQA